MSFNSFHSDSYNKINANYIKMKFESYIQHNPCLTQNARLVPQGRIYRILKQRGAKDVQRTSRARSTESLYNSAEVHRARLKAPGALSFYNNFFILSHAI